MLFFHSNQNPSEKSSCGISIKFGKLILSIKLQDLIELTLASIKTKMSGLNEKEGTLFEPRNRSYPSL